MGRYDKKFAMLSDTAWHVGYIKKDENEPRRHKSRCVFLKSGNECGYFNHCIGSSHCNYYMEDGVFKRKKQMEKIEIENEERAAKYNNAPKQRYIPKTKQTPYTSEEIQQMMGKIPLRKKGKKIKQQKNTIKPKKIVKINDEIELVKIQDFCSKYKDGICRTTLFSCDNPDKERSCLFKEVK